MSATRRLPMPAIRCRSSGSRTATSAFRSGNNGLRPTRRITFGQHSLLEIPIRLDFPSGLNEESVALFPPVAPTHGLVGDLAADGDGDAVARHRLPARG